MNSDSNSILTQQAEDEIEREVKIIWLESPGIGVKELMHKLESLHLSSEITKQRVKAAKQAIPYTYIEPDCSNDDGNEIKAQVAAMTKEKISFVEQKIQERTSVRSLKRHDEADEIMKGLTAMGIVLDDRMKTWTIGKKRSASDSNDNLSNQEITAEQKNSGVACQYCSRYFASKNLVFRHLRDVSTSCGNAIFANGDKLPDAPSTVSKRQKKEAAAEANRIRKKTGKAKQQTDPASTLWFGDLPLPYTRLGGQYRRLRAVLRECLPRDVPQPRIKKVVRKAYRKGGRKVLEKDDGESEGIENGERGEYFGYAIIVFRDEVEANNVKNATDGIIVKPEDVFSTDTTVDATTIPSFSMKVKNVLRGQSSSENAEGETKQTVNVQLRCGGEDPPLLDQLRPLSISELEERCKYLRSRLKAEGGNSSVPGADVEEGNDQCSGDDKESCTSTKHKSGSAHDNLLNTTISLYNAVGSRDELFHQGRIIPDSIREHLLSLLRDLRWPAASHRKGLTSDNYLVLQTNVTNDRFYNDLRIGCRKLMDWTDPDYFYSGIAVTKNFVASPHIDDRDQSFQYAVSLGDFEDGGELCVEGWNDQGVDYVNVVNTHNRIARVDGRNVHWVRSWGRGKDRYSLIFYDTSERHQTDVLKSGIDLTFLSG